MNPSATPLVTENVTVNISTLPKVHTIRVPSEPSLAAAGVRLTFPEVLSKEQSIVFFWRCGIVQKRIICGQYLGTSIKLQVSANNVPPCFAVAAIAAYT